MRWPLKNQILVRMLLLLLITIGAITFASIRSTIAANRSAELERLERLVELISTNRFPLTSTVLENMKSLSGAEFVLADDQGRVVANTSAAPSNKIPNTSQLDSSEGARPQAIVSNGTPYYHTSVQSSKNPGRTRNDGQLHIFVPRQSDSSIWWQASKSPLLIALLALPLAFVLSLAMASQVTRPLGQLENQVKKISDGDIQQIPEMKGSKEIQDLNVSINDMALRLQNHDQQLRKNERLRTMVQVGSGIAHHLRNSATGCKMAVELLGSEHQEIAKSENYEVALRQLGLLDSYIKKFLLLSQSSGSEPNQKSEIVDLGKILENVIFLLGPSAKHLNVEMKVQSNCDQSEIRMPAEDALQLMMNLVSNAVTAANQSTAGQGSERSKKGAFVEVDLRVSNEAISFSVTDNGCGPPDDIANSIFQPFITGSREGTGLGLSVVKDIADRAGGEVNWTRENELTKFTFKTTAKDKARIS